MKFFTVCILMALGSPTLADLLDIPLISNGFEPDQKFTVEDFQKMGRVLESSRLATHLDCEFQARLIHEIHNYQDRSEPVDLLEINFRTEPGIGGGDRFQAKFPRSSIYARLIIANHWSGEGEEYKIYAGDHFGHWLRFIHDGKGEIVSLIMGNSIVDYRCLVKR